MNDDREDRGEAAPAAPWLRYTLAVRPAGADRPWRAVLVSEDGARRCEFDSPEALAQQLARETRAGTPRGLR